MGQLLDTTIFVDSLRGEDRAKAYIKQQPEITCSLVTAAELLQGARDKHEQAQIGSFLIQIKILPFSQVIGDKALSLIRKYTLSHGLEIPDALIAATAIEEKLTLVTANIKHFSFIKTLKLLDWNREKNKLHT